MPDRRDHTRTSPVESGQSPQAERLSESVPRTGELVCVDPAPLVTSGIRDRWRDRTERPVLLATGSVVVSVAMALWKIWFAIVGEASLFWLSNAGFSIGIALSKCAVISAHHRRRTPHATRSHTSAVRHERRMYRVAGAVIGCLSVLYVVSSSFLVFGQARTESYGQIVGIGIATVTFTELAMAIRGTIISRRDGGLAVRAIRLANLANALVLLVLTQSALMSFASNQDSSAFTGVAGMVFGSLGAIIGIVMVAHRLPRS